MSTNDIKKIIQAFYEGDTSPEQENILFNYFSGSNVAEELQQEQEYFIQIYRLEKVSMPPEFSNKIDVLFDSLQHRETILTRLKHSAIWISSIAAALVIIFFIVNNHKTNDRQNLTFTETYLPDIEIKKNDTIGVSKTDKKEVEITPVKEKKRERKVSVVKIDDYQKIKEALESVALNLNEGIEQLNSVSDNLAQTTEIINNKSK